MKQEEEVTITSIKINDYFILQMRLPKEMDASELSQLTRIAGSIARNPIIAKSGRISKINSEKNEERNFKSPSSQFLKNLNNIKKNWKDKGSIRQSIISVANKLKIPSTKVNYYYYQAKNRGLL